MRLFELFDSRGSFRSIEELKLKIKQSESYQNEDLSDMNILLFFKTSKQRTYLLCSSEKLYCILDDSRKTEPRLNWSIPKEELIQDNELVINISSERKNGNSGTVHIGEKHKNWLYSTDLFRSKPIEKKFRSFILNSIGNS